MKNVLMEVLEYKGLTVADLSSKIYMSNKWIYAVASGRIRPRGDDMKLICDILDEDIDKVFFRNHPKRSSAS